MEVWISFVFVGLIIAIIIVACIQSDAKSKPATGVPVAPRRITNEDFEIVRREASCD